MKLQKKRGAFSLIELLVVMGIIGIMVGITSVGIFNARRKTEMDQVRSQIISLLGEARSKSVSQEDGESWGVRFSNFSSSSYYSLFYSSYSTSTEKGRYSLPTNIEYVSSTIPIGSFKEVVFSEISGRASGTQAIPLVLRIFPFTTSTITVSTSGIISY